MLDASLTQNTIDFQTLNNTIWDDADVSVYAVKRKSHLFKDLVTGKKEKKYTYHPFLIQAEEKLTAKLRKAVIAQIKSWEGQEQYASGTQDYSRKTALWLDLSSTDYISIIKQIEENNVKRNINNEISNPQDLEGSIMYIIRLNPKYLKTQSQIFSSNEQETPLYPLYAARRVSRSWGIKKADSAILARIHMKNGKLIDIGVDPIFSVDKTIDFLSLNQTLFVHQKKNFEYLLNLRISLLEKRDNVINDFKDLKIIDDEKLFVAIVGNNSWNLQKVASINERGLYKDPTYLAGIKQNTKENNWHLQFKPDGCIDLALYRDNPKKTLCMLRELNGERKCDRIDGKDCYAGAIVEILDDTPKQIPNRGDTIKKSTP